MMPVTFSLNYIGLTHLAFFIVAAVLSIQVLMSRVKSPLDMSVLVYLIAQTLIGLVSFLTAGFLLHGNAGLYLILPLRIIGYLALVNFAFQLFKDTSSSKFRLLNALFVIITGVSLVITVWAVRSNLAGRVQEDIIDPGMVVALFDLAGILAAAILMSILTVRRTNESKYVALLKAPDVRKIAEALFRPAQVDSITLRSLLICFLISLLPSGATLFQILGIIPPDIAVYIRDIGTLLVVLVVYITYLNQSQRTSSINNKLMAISLTLVMVIFILVAAHENSLVNNQIGLMRSLQIQAMRFTMNGDVPELLPDDMAYLAYRSSGAPEDPSSYKLVYLSSSAINLQGLLEEKSEPLAIADLINRDYTQHFRDVTLLARFGKFNTLFGMDTISYRFEENARVFEAGFSASSHLDMIHKHALYLLFLYMVYAVVILFVLPVFYRTYLTKPLEILLNGVRQAQTGNLKIMLPAQFEDEIGILTHAFNDMINTIRLAQGELRQINEELEERVRLRTAELAESEERYRHLATIDPLTGLYNRRYFYEKAGQEIARVTRYNQNVAAMMLDIDHFKKVNDTYGHAAGDVVLREVAVCCQQSVREVDIIARYGGEEFVVILPEATIEKATQVAERLRLSVADLVIRHPEEDKDIRVTISVGVSDFNEERKTLEQILSAADQALYQSKQNGRNRVTVIE